MATEEKTYDSGPSRPDDELWLTQGRKGVEESLPAIREGAKNLMTGLGALEGIYVAILSFSDFAKQMAAPAAALFALPLVIWLVALHSCLTVMKTKECSLNLFAPEQLRNNHEQVLKGKQRSLTYAFWELTVGLIAAILLIAFAPELRAALPIFPPPVNRREPIHDGCEWGGSFSGVALPSEGPRLSETEVANCP